MLCDLLKESPMYLQRVHRTVLLVLCRDLRTHQLCLDHDHNRESQLKRMTSLVDLILHCKQGAPFPNNYISLHQLQGPGSGSSGLVCTSSHAREILWKPPFSLPCPEPAHNHSSVKQDSTEFRREQAIRTRPWAVDGSKLYCIKLYSSNYCSR